jgi:hypothetical protein
MDSSSDSCKKLFSVQRGCIAGMCFIFTGAKLIVACEYFNYVSIFAGQVSKSVVWAPVIPSPIQHPTITLHEITVHRT